jgi:hypothetical protein
VDNISLSVSAHSRLRSISDQDTTLTILKRKVTVIVLECMHKLHLLGRFLTSTHDLDVISMASVELRRVKVKIFWIFPRNIEIFHILQQFFDTCCFSGRISSRWTNAGGYYGR